MLRDFVRGVVNSGQFKMEGWPTRFSIVSIGKPLQRTKDFLRTDIARDCTYITFVHQQVVLKSMTSYSRLRWRPDLIARQVK